MAARAVAAIRAMGGDAAGCGGFGDGAHRRDVSAGGCLHSGRRRWQSLRSALVPAGTGQTAGSAATDYVKRVSRLRSRATTPATPCVAPMSDHFRPARRRRRIRTGRSQRPPINCRRPPAPRPGQGPTVYVIDAYGYPNAEPRPGGLPFAVRAPVQCNTARTSCFRKIDQNGHLPTANFPADNSGWAAESALDLDMVSADLPALQDHPGRVDRRDGQPVPRGRPREPDRCAKFISMSWGRRRDRRREFLRRRLSEPDRRRLCRFFRRRCVRRGGQLSLDVAERRSRSGAPP